MDRDEAFETGYLKRNAPIESMARYEIKVLNEKSLHSMINLQDIILNDLQNPILYEPASPELFTERLVSKKLVVGVEVEGELIAFGIIQIPGESKENLGTDIGMAQGDLLNVSHIQFIVVHPHFRGNSLQNKIAKYLLSIIKEMKYQYVLGTISPDNYYSLKNMLQLGFVIRELKEKYGGKLRYIIYKDVTIIQDQKWLEIIKINADDIDGQKKLLRNGFVGFNVQNDLGKNIIIFGKKQ